MSACNFILLLTYAFYVFFFYQKVFFKYLLCAEHWARDYNFIKALNQKSGPWAIPLGFQPTN